MKYTEPYRKILLGLFISMLVVLLLFVGPAGRIAVNVQHILQETEQYAADKEQEYVELSKIIHYGFLETLHSDWLAYQTIAKDPDFREFVASFVPPFLTVAQNSIIAVGYNGDKDIFFNPGQPYSEVEVPWGLIPRNGTTVTLNGTHFIGRTFGKYSVYVGFTEQAVLQGFIRTLHVEGLERAKGDVLWLATYLHVLLAVLILYALVFAYYLHKLQLLLWKEERYR